MKYFNSGDKISFLNESLYGEVISQLSDRHVIVECQGIEMDVSVDDIIKISTIPKFGNKEKFPNEKAIKKIDNLPGLVIDSKNSSDLFVGDIVSFMNDNCRGIIIAILSDNMYDVKIESGFTIPVNRVEIEKVWQIDSNFSNKGIKKKIKNDIYKSPPKLSKKNRVADISINHNEIDLHIENITDTWNHLSNLEIIFYQISSFKKRLYQAFEDNENHFIVIHGVGKGVLKNKIAEIVKRYPNVSMCPADMNVYGMGASQITIH